MSRHTTVSRFTIRVNTTHRWSLEILRDDKMVILSVVLDYIISLTNFCFSHTTRHNRPLYIRARLLPMVKLRYQIHTTPTTSILPRPIRMHRIIRRSIHHPSRPSFPVQYSVNKVQGCCHPVLYLLSLLSRRSHPAFSHCTRASTALDQRRHQSQTLLLHHRLWAFMDIQISPSIPV